MYMGHMVLMMAFLSKGFSTEAADEWFQFVVDHYVVSGI